MENTGILTALLKDDADAMKALLEGVDLNERNERGHTLLGEACIMGLSRCATLLVELGADVAVHDDHGWTPAMWAASCGNTDLLKLLIGAGADVNAAAPSGKTALTEAVGDAKCVRLLIDAGADVNAADAEGCTPLMLARLVGDVKSAAMLVEAGAMEGELVSPAEPKTAKTVKDAKKPKTTKKSKDAKKTKAVKTVKDAKKTKTAKKAKGGAAPADGEDGQ